MDKLKVTYQRPADLKPRATNPRTHSKKQVGQIADSITQFGFTNPILIDGTGGIVAGHGRVEAAMLLGIVEIPTIRLEDLTEAQIRTYVIADNKLAENAGWDRELLAIELQGLIELETDFDVTITGFETPEIDILIGELDADEYDDPADEIPALDDGPPVTRSGDVWNFGKHRLFCGDALNRDSYCALMGNEKAQMVFSDLPYNVSIPGHVSGLGKNKHDNFIECSGEMSGSEHTSFLTTGFERMAEFSVDGSLHYLMMDWRHAFEILSAGRTAYTALQNLCVWVKTNGGMGSLYRSQHELVFVFKAGTAPHINNIELGKYGRYRTNVWSYAGMNSFGAGRDEALAMHPTVKPVRLVADAILDCSKRNGIILDAFAGSGTTLIAAEKTGRRGFGIEIDPHYCDVIARRFATTFNVEAVHAETGKTFADMEQERTTAVIGHSTGRNAGIAEEVG